MPPLWEDYHRHSALTHTDDQTYQLATIYSDYYRWLPEHKASSYDVG